MNSSSTLYQRVKDLRGEIERGELAIEANSPLKQSIDAVAYNGDGSLNIDTVHSDVIALLDELDKHKEKVNRYSLYDVQKAYFEGLEEFLGPLRTQMKNHHSDPHLIAVQAAETNGVVKAFASERKKFTDLIRSFWSDTGASVINNAASLGSSVCSYSGDISPLYTSNIATGAGLYLDTILIPDPLTKLGNIAEFAPANQAVYYFIKHALNILSYKELAIAFSPKPIIAIIPDIYSLGEENYRGLLDEKIEEDLLHYIKITFGKDVESQNDARDFLSKFDSADEIKRAVVDQNQFVFDSYATTFDDHLKGIVKHNKRLLPSHSKATLGEKIFHSILGRQVQANDAYMMSQIYGSVPICDAEASWFHLQSLLSRKARPKQSEKEQMIVAHALQVASEKGLLTGLSSNSVIELRRLGLTDELRAIISNGIEDIEGTDDDSQAVIAARISENIRLAVADYEKKLAALRDEEKKVAGILPVSTATLFMTIAARAIPVPDLQTGMTLLGQIISLPKLWEVGVKIMKIGRDRTIRQSAASILIQNNKSINKE